MRSGANAGSMACAPGPPVHHVGSNPPRVDERINEVSPKDDDIRYVTYDPATRVNPIRAGSHTAGESPTDRCEYSAPVRSKVRPANAHSLMCVRTGATTATTPSILAVPRNRNRYGGYPRWLNTVTAPGEQRTAGSADRVINVAARPVTAQRIRLCIGIGVLSSDPGTAPSERRLHWRWAR